MNSTAKTDVATLPSSPKAQAAKEVIALDQPRIVPCDIGGFRYLSWKRAAVSVSSVYS